MNNKNKSCENCAHFFQHYGWICSQFQTIYCGHCIKRKLTPKEKRSFPFSEGCEEWQPKEQEIAKRKESIQDTLRFMTERIDEIAMLLESDYLKP